MADDTAWIQTQAELLGYTKGDRGVSQEDVLVEMGKITSEDNDSLPEIDALINKAQDDFEEPQLSPSMQEYAEELMHAYIKDTTRAGHVRIAKAYIAYHSALDPFFKPGEISESTPRKIVQFIAYKCGPPEKGGQGRKFATAVSTRAAMSYYHQNLPGREHESTTEWRYDEHTGKWHGLPTRSRLVSKFMVGLEKTKAAAGEISQSARALTLQDMHRLFDLCVARTSRASIDVQRQGIVRYVSMSLTFESIDKIPGERGYFDVHLGPRKTQQTGIGHSWRLHANDDDHAVCPVRAILRLLLAYGHSVHKSGSLFLRVNAQGAIDQTKPLTSSALSRALAKDLQDLSYTSWRLYGTHSFRRGGCQYRIKVKGWTVDMVAAWGGWSQVEAVTMFRYFYSPNDNHERLNDYDYNGPQRNRVLF
ncbi:hypothetical protein K523DRAFT_374110 [Schizophyllum commune Tattone D]|nr:hypothetical protein K523DRAFT_374110 [Schizophyllum commune Tattone D]